MRIRRLPRTIEIAALFALAAAAAAPLAAQRAPQTQRGWLGFSFGSSATVWVPGRATTDTARVVVGEVLKGSPADRAGMEPGDTLVSVNGERATMGRIAQAAARLHPGDTVRLDIRRAGRTQALTLRAAERPSYMRQFGYAPGPITVEPGEFYFPVGDSIRHTMRIYLDSARMQLDSLHIPRMRIERHDSVMIFHGPDDKVDTVRIRPFERGLTRIRTGADSMLVKLQDNIWTLQRDGLPGFEVDVMGRRGIAGASLQELNSQLAEYFGVREGLLVERVTTGTPAARAGLQAGDVVIAADGRPVGDIADLRRALRGREGTVKLDLVRKGKKETASIKWP